MKRKVKLKTLRAGPHGIDQPGATVECSAEEAKALVEGGYAEYVNTQSDTGQATVEVATVAPPERAVSQRGRKGKNA